MLSFLALILTMLQTVQSQATDVEALNRQTVAAVVSGRWDVAISLAELALRTAKEQKSTGLVLAHALSNSAELYRRAGRIADAIPLFVDALAAYSSLSNPLIHDHATTLNNYALLKTQSNEVPEAERLFNQSIVVFRRVSLPSNSEYANTLNNLGDLYLSKGEDDRAIAAYLEASFLPSSSKYNLVYSLTRIAEANVQKGEEQASHRCADYCDSRSDVTKWSALIGAWQSHVRSSSQ